MTSSLLLSLSSEPSLHKLALRCQTLRTFSSSTRTNPCLLYRVTCAAEKGEEESPGVMTQLHTFDPVKEKHIVVGDKPFPKELVGSSLVGSSHGWGVYLWGQRSITISDFCNPLSFNSKPKFIPLLLRPDIISCQADIVCSVAMSSSPDHEEEQEDYLVAVKFLGRPVSIYMPSKAVHRTLPHNVFDHFEPSKLIYSKRDQRFYMPSSGGHHLWSWDGHESTEPEFHELRFHNLPQFSPSELQLLDSCHRTHHLVESPSGQRFLIKWYIQSIKALRFNCGGTKQFMVFREEEDMNMCYTEDIGDLCIFLGDNEPFVVKAGLFPGLKPNSIYYVGEGYGEGYGVYNIATRTPSSFKPKPTTPVSPSGKGFMLPLWAPHWLPPFPL